MSDPGLMVASQYRPLPERPSEIDGGGVLRLAMLPDCARFVLRIAPADMAAAGQVFGLALPEAIGAVAEADGRLALKLGPDEWRLHAAESDGAEIAARFAAELGTTPHSLVDISHREIGIEVSGTAALDVLTALCPLDLAARPVGSGTRTVFDRVEAVVLRQAENQFRLEVWQSFAPFLYSLLEIVGQEVEAGL
ncbi:sarcosine oxidase subunit gamma [Virgifigura deserti]|uniref:sarcosine oxidase subunit gamma n=1 Tax=Virgifigura deserti TaxID=2268457 RepID=UPI003CCB98B5